MSFGITTHVRTELVDITNQVQDAVVQARVRSGMCFVFVPHTTAGVTVNESYDSDVARDVTATLSKLVPHCAGYAHSEGNADAHIKSVLVGCCQAIPVEEGRLALGQWQGVLFCEFDGPRQRRVQVQLVNT
ncbi:YjbQ family protein [candidate division WOR-3 bacterium]|nr:YjbQ family protein [candidate division WOR-3 bacterium]